MRRDIAILAIAALGALAATVAGAGDERYEESATRTIRQTIPLEAGQALVVDNLNGPIRVTGSGGSEVRLVAVERIRARTAERLDQARREVTLAIHPLAEALVICADGPFRDPDDCTEWREERHRESRYEVSYEIELQVPDQVVFSVRTVHGDIEVRDVRGNFDVRGVNGELTMTGVAGSGRAGTVNGPVRVVFVENPVEDSSFTTVNGDVDVTFAPGLSADLSFKTLNGEILSDFDYELLAPRTIRRESRGATRFRLDSRSAVRIGSGGPEFEFENINGDILIRRDR